MQKNFSLQLVYKNSKQTTKFFSLQMHKHADVFDKNTNAIKIVWLCELIPRARKCWSSFA